MRDLKRYLSRRKIKDVKSWAQDMGFSTIDDLAVFCEASTLRFNRDEYVVIFERAEPDSKHGSPVPASPDTSAADPGSPQKVWHTPAAKRPLKKTPAATTRTTKPEKTSVRSKKES
jgi:hypothetical protein